MAPLHPAIAGEAAWQRAVREYIERLRQHYRERLAAVVLYGSRARGDADPESDADVLVVLKDGCGDRTEERVVWDMAQEVNETTGYHLTGPIVVAERDYRHRMLPLLMNIRREGIELWTAKRKAVREEREQYQAEAADEVALIRRHMREALEDAEAALAQRRYNSAANRAYYAMFHAATALLLSKGLAFSRHRTVIGAFADQFVRTGVFPAGVGKALGDGFRLRNIADYSYAEEVVPAEIEKLVSSAAAFVAEAERLLDR